MKNTVFIFITIIFFACSQPSNNSTALQSRIDSLEKKLEAAYKPGFGDFMSSIQAHHNKLWFAGQNQNWKLADFEIHEIMEAVDNIKKYQSKRKETETIPIIEPALDSVNLAIQQKDPALFKERYVVLTNTCNTCHQQTGFEFNVVKVPETTPFSNQDFKGRK